MCNNFVSTNYVQLVRASVQCGDVSVGNWKVAKWFFQLEVAWLAAARMANRKV